MIFYDCATAPSPRRARIFIAEKGLDIETREISIAEGAQLAPEFLQVNPRATVPVLVTDEGTVITENLGIAAYLEAAHPEPPLMGRTPDEKGLVMMWTAIIEQQGFMAIAEALRNSSPRMKDRALPGPQNYAQIPELAERGKARLGQFYGMMNDHLAESPFVAGEAFSLADITLLVAVDFARVIRMPVPEDHAALTGWHQRMRERPSAAL
ncbi:glutathione S-transferase family protein [Lutimaribacter marinistellae]|uniref:Glutathione S-transferase family protein n=1 Tax=Lutimaribacter marinistellae TaxID=1820329 RepID=A0ABV7TJ20_9RHOB